MSIPRTFGLAALGAGAATAIAATANSVSAGSARVGPSEAIRTNFRGARVSLAGGPALSAGTALAAVTVRQPRLAVLTVAVGALGGYDDLRGQVHARGLRGHWQALREGTVTTGAVKVVGLVIFGLMCAPRSDAVMRATDAGLIAGTANLINLLDLRPGRALKVLGAGSLAIAASDPIGATALLGPVLAGLPDDLAERSMLGDCGANVGGAVLGWLAANAWRPRARFLGLAGVIALTLASERVSFNSVIEGNPLLARIDGLGRAG